MNLSAFPKYAFIFLLTLAVCPALRADTVFTWARTGSELLTSESTNLLASSYGNTFKNGDVLKINSDVITQGGQFNADSIGASGTVTIQSATSGKQVTITCQSGLRFCDYAYGTYILSDLKFLNYGKYGDNGGVFYRDNLEPTTFVLSNVTVEGAIGNTNSAFRAAKSMTVSGTATFKDNKVKDASGAALTAAGGALIFQGDSTNITFTGSQYGQAGNFQVGYDVAGSSIQFNDAGTYSLGGGILTGGTVTINGANVTLGADSKSSVTGKTLLQAGTLTIDSANYATSAVEVSAGATLKLKNTLSTSLTNNGTTVLYTATPTLTNLAGTSTTSTFEWDSSVTGTKSITLHNTTNTNYTGTFPTVSSITKTGPNEINLQKGIPGTGVKILVKEGTLSIGDSTSSTLLTINGDVTLDGGTLKTCNTAHSGNGKVVSNLYVTENGGGLAINSGRGYVTGILAAPGADTSNATVKFSGARFFVGGTSTFKGYFELTGGYTHFTNEALASTKGLVLNGGILQYSGETPAGGTKDLSAPIYIKGNSSIQCGWNPNVFNLNGPISDWSDSDLTGKTLTITSDGGFVSFNGEVNTKAILQLNDNAKIGGANNATFGGLSGTKTDKGLTLAAATTKNLTLNVAASTSPSYSAQLTGAFNLVKEGAGTQTFATTGIGSAASPLNSITINEGSVKMTNGAPIYTNALTINEGGKLEFGTGTYKIKSETLGGTGEIALAFDSEKVYTTLDFSGSTFTEASPALVSLDQSTYTLEQFKTYTIAKNVPLGADFNYKSLLKGDDAYYFNLTRSGDSLVLQMDNNAVPEPATWLLLLLGGHSSLKPPLSGEVARSFKASPFRGGGTQCRRGREEAV